MLAYCHAEGIKVVPRGAGTSLSGGALPLADGVLLGMAKFNRIREIDFDNRVVVAEPGVTNLAVTQAVEHAGFYYAPDPSSQIACTIGGNVAENSGGVHCLKYGMTTNNVLGCEIVLMTGEVVRLGGKHLDAGGYDLLGVITGSEGLLGVVTEVTVRILREAGMRARRADRLRLIGGCRRLRRRIIGAGIIPGGMEMMDRPAIHAVEEFVHAGYPLDVEALLIVELDGPQAEVDHLIARVEAIARECRAVSCGVSRSEAERLLFWAGRKAAFPAVGRISPDYYCMDGTIPRAQLPLVLARMRELSEHYGLRVANVFHAGDGNLHPLILYDANKPGELERAEAFGADILRLCVEVGGVLTGEHGVGVEKRDLMPVMFTEADLNQQQRLKCAFDDQGPAQSRQGVSDAAPLRRARPHARARRQGGVSGYSAVLAVTDPLKPRDAKDVEDAVQWALGAGKALEIVGQGTKRAIGRPAQSDLTLDLSGLSGVTLYEPEELVLSARAGTPLAEIEALVASTGQQLAFEPMDYGPLLGGAAGRGTIGGVLAANLSGPRRIKAGAARDHFLGFSAVSGRGETFKSGGRVVKNVTGYDLCKLMAGSWGTLAAMTEVTIKVLPQPETESTVIVRGLDDEAAMRAMTAAMGLPCDVSGAAHLPAAVGSAHCARRGALARSRRCGSKALRPRWRIARRRCRRS